MIINVLLILDHPGDCQDSYANKQFTKDKNLFFSGVGLPRHRWKDGIVPFAFIYSEFSKKNSLIKFKFNQLLNVLNFILSNR